MALAIGSVALFADSVDFLEDTAISLLIALALGWGARHRAIAGKVMAGVLLVPAAAAVWQAVQKWGDPAPPDVRWLVLTALGAALVNGVCAWLLVRVRHAGGSLSRAAYLSARNDVLVNLLIVAMAAVTAADGVGVARPRARSRSSSRSASTPPSRCGRSPSEEHLAARALAGDEVG